MTQHGTPASHALEKEPSGAAKQFAGFAPGLAGFTDDVLFGQVWTRPELSPPGPQPGHRRGADDLGEHRAARLPPRPRPPQRRDGNRADRGDHPPGVLRRLAEGDVRHGRRQAGLRQQAREDGDGATWLEHVTGQQYQAAAAAAEAN
jgi:hypothetical protein